MDMQQSQLDQLRQWLTKTEDKISHMATTEPSHSSLNDQLNQLHQLENDINEQQDIVDGLKNIIVVVDEENSETIYAQMEDQLSALDERWSHICKWKDEWGERLKSFTTTWDEFTDDYKKLESWLNETEITVKQMEAVPVSELGEILERVKRLRILKIDMERNQKRLVKLQTSVQNFSNDETSTQCMEFLEKIENLQDQWEAVGQIMEVQSQRVGKFY